MCSFNQCDSSKIFTTETSITETSSRKRRETVVSTGKYDLPTQPPPSILRYEVGTCTPNEVKLEVRKFMCKTFSNNKVIANVVISGLQSLQVHKRWKRMALFTSKVLVQCESSSSLSTMNTNCLSA